MINLHFAIFHTQHGLPNKPKDSCTPKPSDTASCPSSRIHHIAILLFVVLHNGNLLSLAHLIATHGTRPFAPQPRTNTLQIKTVLSLTRQLDDEAVLVLQVGDLADSAVILLVELLPVHSLQHIDKLLARALQPRRRVVDVALQGLYQLLQEIAVVFCRRGRLQRLKLALQEAEERGCVDRRGRGVRVVMGAFGAAWLVELVEEGEEGGHVDAAALATGLGELYIVFDCG